MAKTTDIEGIGRKRSVRLEEAGIETTDDLLERCGSAAGRAQVAVQSGLSPKQLLKWANLADLYRIKGIGSEWSELLEAAGVDTVTELRYRNPTNLWAKLEQVNEEKRLARALPSAAQVSDWVDQARRLDPKISH